MIKGPRPYKLTPTAYQMLTRETGLYPEGGTGSLAAVEYCALGLGEAGEVQGKVKKVKRGDKSLNEMREGILDELGDTLWYVVRTADELGESFQQLIDRNANKVHDRFLRGVTKGDGR